MAGIGIACHELGHTIGFTDMYGVNNTTTGSTYDQGIGGYSLYGAGGYSDDYPPYPDAFQRLQEGWLTPIFVTSNSTNLSLPPTEKRQPNGDLPTVGIVTMFGKPGHSNTSGQMNWTHSEYFILENRQRLGSEVYLARQDSVLPAVGGSLNGGTYRITPELNYLNATIETYPAFEPPNVNGGLLVYQRGVVQKSGHYTPNEFNSQCNLFIVEADGNYDLSRTDQNINPPVTNGRAASYTDFFRGNGISYLDSIGSATTASSYGNTVSGIRVYNVSEPALGGNINVSVSFPQGSVPTYNYAVGSSNPTGTLSGRIYCYANTNISNSFASNTTLDVQPDVTATLNNASLVLDNFKIQGVKCGSTYLGYTGFANPSGVSIQVSGNWTIGGGSNFTIQKPVKFNLSSGVGASITVQPTARLRATGISFTQNVAGQSWRSIFLQGNNNSFTNCTFDGAALQGVSVTSTGNTFTNCTFQNMVTFGYGIRSDYTASGARSSFTLDGGTVQNCVTGISAYNTNAIIKNTRIISNKYAGLNVYNSTVSPLYRSRIANNFTLYPSTGSDYAGIDILSGGNVQMSVSGGGGYNQIWNNNSYDIYVGSGGTLFAGYPTSSAEGRNSFIHTLSNGRRREHIANYTSSSINAYSNYWGNYNGPSSSQFYGSVNYSPYLSTDPTGGTPYRMQSGEGSGKGSFAMRAQREGLANNDATSTAFDKTQSDAYLSERLRELCDILNTQPASANTAGQIDELSELADLAETGLVNSTASAEANAVIEMWSAKLPTMAAAMPRSESKGNSGAGSSKDSAAIYEQLGSETALLSELSGLMRSEAYDQARQKVAARARYVNGTMNRVSLKLVQLSLCEQAEKYADALALLNEVRKLDEETASHYEVVEQMLNLKLAAQSEHRTEQSRDIVQSNEQGNSMELIENKVPTAFGLNQNYPNPFNPTTTIRYQLPKQSKVSLKVFDVLGRVVAELVNETKAAGYYQMQFNGSKLSSGTYFYKLIAGGFVQTKKLVLIK